MDMIIISLLATLVFMGVHILSPRFSLVLSARIAAASSFGAGIAAAFVFLELLPAIEHGHELIGESIEFVILGGFIAVFSMHSLAHRVSREKARTFPIVILTAFAYNWLLIYSFPRAGGAYDLVISGLFILHLAFYDRSIREEDPIAFDAWGRWMLVAATFLGWVALWVLGHPGPLLEDVLIGLLAGAIIYQIFTVELSVSKETRFLWFIGGVVVYVAIFLVGKAIEMPASAV